MGVSVGSHKHPPEEKEPILSQGRRYSRKEYGTINGEVGGGRHHSDDSLDCPTCQGTGRIPRGQEKQLVALIPYSDQRLKPRHTKLYVCISVFLCLLICSLFLFFLFPRSVFLSSVGLQSVYVFYDKPHVNMTITNMINITNDNFYAIHATGLDIQALILETVAGKVKIANVTMVKPRSTVQYIYTVEVSLEAGLYNYCTSATINIHTLFLHLQMTMNASYLAHSEQLSLETYEYIDCGTNTTTPRKFDPSPGAWLVV
ncbi:transmembrane protein 106A isoform X2 [Amia ocellicauda]|nr:T106B protein [Amia calva]